MNKPSPTTIDQALLLGRKQLAHSLAAAGEEADLRTCTLEAELLLARVLGVERLFVRIHKEKILTPAQEEDFLALIGRRGSGEPMAYLVGVREFFGRDFQVRPGVLIPRPETELLVETALEVTDSRHARGTRLAFADLGAGSGAIGLTLALERPAWRGVLAEISPAALYVCEANRRALGAHNCLVVQADLFCSPLAPGSLDLLVANPPYIDEHDEQVQAGVRAHEPGLALFSPNHGLAHLQACVDTAANLLKKGGYLLLEHGYEQGPWVRQMLRGKNFSEILTKKDLAGLDRTTLARV